MTWPPKPDKMSPAVAALIAAKAPKTRKKRTPHEANMQITIVEELARRTIRPACFWFVPNGGNLSKAQRGMFKAMGLTPGVYDLHFAWGSGAGACFGAIELKYGRGDTSDKQDAWGVNIEECGHTRAVCWSRDEVMDVLASWNYPLRKAI